jgi:hypothetical protein
MKTKPLNMVSSTTKQLKLLERIAKALETLAKRKK